MSTKDDTVIARRFEPTGDGRFVYRGQACDYILTREHAAEVSQLTERLEGCIGVTASILVFALFLAPLLVGEYASPPVASWLPLYVISMVFAYLAILALGFLARRMMLEALLKGRDCESVPRTEDGAERWHRRLKRFRLWAVSPTVPTKYHVLFSLLLVFWTAAFAKSWGNLELQGQGAQDWATIIATYTILAIVAAALIFTLLIVYLNKKNWRYSDSKVNPDAG
jgi:MFS family permease